MLTMEYNGMQILQLIDVSWQHNSCKTTCNFSNSRLCDNISLWIDLGFSSYFVCSGPICPILLLPESPT